MNATRDPLGDWEPLAPEELLCGKYSIGHRLGAGAMGIVYHAEHVQLRLPVAIKVMRGELSGAWSGIERMLREARAAARLKSEHIVRVLDVGRLDDGLPFIVMEYLEGTDLAQLVQRVGKLSLYDAIDYVVQACDGISEAHAASIVHRDIKPENLFLTTRTDGTPLVKVFDFGVSKELGAHALRVTDVASAVGSPAYMSPEQMRAEDHVDGRADIWALGVVLTELCTGHLPYPAQSLAALFETVQSNQPRLPRSYEPSLPQELDDIVQRCLQPEPDARFATAAELASALLELMTQLPHPSRVQSRRFRSSGSTPNAPTLGAPAVQQRGRTIALLAIVALSVTLTSLAMLTRNKYHPRWVEPRGAQHPTIAQGALNAPAVSVTPSQLAVEAAAVDIPVNATVSASEITLDARQGGSTERRQQTASQHERLERPAEVVRGAPILRSTFHTTVQPLPPHEPVTSIASPETPPPIDVLELDRVDDEPVGDDPLGAPGPRADVALEPWNPESFGGRR